MAPTTSFQPQIYNSELDSHAKAYSFTTSDLAKYYHLPINEAAKQLEICTSVLKKICRKQGIKRWPHRKFKSLDRLISSLGDEQEVEKLREKRALLLLDPNIEYTEIIPKSKLNSCNSYLSKIKGPTKTIKKAKAQPITHLQVMIPLKSYNDFIDTKPTPAIVSTQLFTTLPKYESKEEPKTEKVEIIKLESDKNLIFEDDMTEEDEDVANYMTIDEPELRSSVKIEESAVLEQNEKCFTPASLHPREEMTEENKLKMSMNSLTQFNAILNDCKTYVSYGRLL